jgi:hypothetical protein
MRPSNPASSGWMKSENPSSGIQVRLPDRVSREALNQSRGHENGVGKDRQPGHPAFTILHMNSFICSFPD